MMEDFDSLKKRYCETAGDIIALLPTMLAMIDFRKTKDFELTTNRTKNGYYGTITDGNYIAPIDGEYSGFFKNIRIDSILDFREILDGAKES